MYANNFATQLRGLMKKRKISGQKIADRLSLSQKTVSRYANGEVYPSEEIRKKVLQAVADISGYPEDAILKPSVNLIHINNIDNYKEYMITSDQQAQIEEMECERDKSNALRRFALLKQKNQKYILDNYEVFSNLEYYEIFLLVNWNKLSDVDKLPFWDMVELVRFDLKKINQHKDISQKVTYYMQMISRCNDVASEDFNKLIENFEDKDINLEYSKNLELFMKKIEGSMGLQVEILAKYLYEMLMIDENDWYLLMLIQIKRLSDAGSNDLYNTFVGDKLFKFYQLINLLSE